MFAGSLLVAGSVRGLPVQRVQTVPPMITALLIDDADAYRAPLREALSVRGGTLVDRSAPVDLDAIDIVVIADPPGAPVVRQVRATHPRLPVVVLATSAQELRVASESLRALAVVLVAEPLDASQLARDLLMLVARNHADHPVAPLPDFAEELATLRANFTARLPDKLAELAAAIAAARVDKRHLSAARSLAHRLGGSVGSYGHAELGATLVAMERALASGAGPELDALIATARLHVQGLLPEHV